MILDWIELQNFRNYKTLSFSPDHSGVIVIVGDNGQGKTSLLEAMAFMATKKSFRGATKEGIISYESEEAIVRGGFESSQQRKILVEASIARSGRDRFLVNKQPLSRVSDINKTVPVTVFATQDIEIVRGAPALRREFLDGCVATLYPRGASVISSVERVLRQRGMLLKQSGGILTSEISSTLDVWDRQLGDYGSRLSEMRDQLVLQLEPYVDEAYRRISGRSEPLSLSYRRSWNEDLYKELLGNRKEDLRRQTNGIGPHRDELEIELGGHPVRYNGSQGEQRTAAYSLKTAFHSLYSNQIGEEPILLLDDVFSELDSRRSEAILSSVKASQTIVTTTGEIPSIVHPTSRIFIKEGAIFDSLE